MLNVLKDLYRNRCVIDEMPKRPSDYVWYKDSENHLIGIEKGVPEGERKLLSLVFEEIAAIDFGLHQKLMWLNFLLKGQTKILAQLPRAQKRLRFLFFNHNFETEARTEFEHLIQEFSDHFLTLFIDREIGVVLDFNKEEAYGKEELEDLAEAVGQDFYADMGFYMTAYYEVDELLTAVFREELAFFQRCRRRGALVMEKPDLLLGRLMEAAGQDDGFRTFKSRIRQMPEDQLAVVQAYLENNFNLSGAASQLHMHRNTFMNKIDRFSQSTGLNVKSFDHALIAYLLINK